MMKIRSIFKMSNTLKFIIWCYLVHSNYAARRPVSPCPNVFQFEGEPENDRWSGVINFSSNIELAGLTYKIQLDRPSQLLVSWDGEVRSDDNTLYHVNNQYRVQRPGEMGRAQIMVKFDPAFGVPNIAKIVINGNTVCSINGDGRPNGQNNGNRVPGVVLSADSTTTERFDPSFNENEDNRPDYPYGSQSGNPNYGPNYNQGNANSNVPNRVPTNVNNYGNQNIPSNNYGNSNGPYGGTSNTNAGSLGNPNYGNSNQGNHNGPSDVIYPSNNYGNSNGPYGGTSNTNAGSLGNPNYGNSNQGNHNGPSDVIYPYNPQIQSGSGSSYNPTIQSGSGSIYGNNRPQSSDNNYNNNPNQGGGGNWPNNGGGVNGGFSNNNANSSNTAVYSANNQQQILQLVNNLLNQQQNQNASSPAFVVAILPVPGSPEPVITRNDSLITTENTQKFKTTANSNFTTPTTPTTSSTTSSVINRIRTSTSTSNAKPTNNNGNGNSRS